MNYYVIVEGLGEKYVYKSWIPQVNPSLSYVSDLSKVQDNNFYIISGGGYPNYFKIIEDGINEVNQLGFFHKLVISVDAEEMTYNEKFTEIYNYINQFCCSVEIKIIIQYYCLESWGLGNQTLPRRNTTDEELRSYYLFFDVTKSDPELLPSIDPKEITRAQFSYKYLHKIIIDRYTGITYEN